MDSQILEFVDYIYRHCYENSIRIKHEECTEFSKKMLELSKEDFSNLINTIVSDKDKSEKFFVTIAFSIILCKGDKYDRNLLLVDRLFKSDRFIVKTNLSPVIAALAWTYLTRVFCAVTNIPECHYGKDIQTSKLARPDFEGIENTLVKICSSYTDILRENLQFLSFQEEEIGSSPVLSANKYKISKYKTNIIRKHEVHESIVKLGGDSRLSKNHRDQVNLLQMSIFILLNINIDSLVGIWLILGFCCSISNQELIPINMDSISFRQEPLYKTGCNGRINLDEDTLIVICKLIGRCLLLFNARNHEIYVKRIILKKIRDTLCIIQRRSICEIMPCSSSFISSYIVFVEKILARN
ncbi:putative secreted protein [Cryptosporidium felis]|nr:putative secreted protein [Cryptosporidium felis]